MELLGHVAQEGETAESGAFQLTVLSVEDKKIQKIRLVISTAVEENSQE